MLEVLERFRDTASVRQTAAQRHQLLRCLGAGRPQSKSLRELAESTGRTLLVQDEGLDPGMVNTNSPCRSGSMIPLSISRARRTMI